MANDMVLKLKAKILAEDGIIILIQKYTKMPLDGFFLV